MGFVPFAIYGYKQKNFFENSLSYLITIPAILAVAGAHGLCSALLVDLRKAAKRDYKQLIMIKRSCSKAFLKAKPSQESFKPFDFDYCPFLEHKWVSLVER